MIKSTAALYLKTLVDRGIKYVFANAGTDFAPIIEAMVHLSEQGLTVPEFITVPHENVAMAMAHGYYRSSGEPAAVMVHVTVGTANALCGVMNAARDNVPTLLIAGKTPNTEIGSIGSRGPMIHWGQDCFDQGGMVREYVKWDYELRSGQPVDVIVGRALDIAMTEPRGPVYLTMPREVLDEQAGEEPMSSRQRSSGAIATQASTEAIEKAAEAIINAKFPLILTSALGRNPDNVERLGKLADEFGIAVVQPFSRDLNLASDHMMNLGVQPGSAVQRADVIIVIDCEVPWTPSTVKARADATLIHMAADPFFADYPLRGFEMDIAIAGSSSTSLKMLYDVLQTKLNKNKEGVSTRRETIINLHHKHLDQCNKLIEEASALTPVHPAWLAACVNQVKQADTVIVNELGVTMDLLDLSLAGTYIASSHAGGLGLGLGASLGAKLARPDRGVILLVGNGSYMFGNPTPAHYVARAEGLPTLTVIANNQRWHSVHSSTAAMYPDGKAVSGQTMPLVELSPSPDFELIMKACGGYGERVEDPADLISALQRGLDAVDSGTPALLNVITQAWDRV
ncbi:MAG: thiamine pyrophosphate-requiring protein [Acidiferrobacterales bacterium]